MAQSEVALRGFSDAESKAEASKIAGVLFPLTAPGIDMGNTMSIDMGNTFSAPPAVGATVGGVAERLHTSSQTPPVRPLEACDEVCSRSREMFISLRRGRKCYLCLCPECYPCLCPLPLLGPLPARSSQGEDEKLDAALGLHGFTPHVTHGPVQL